MTLREAIDRYIAWQRSHGAKFETSAYTLLRFAKGIDGEIACDAVTRSQVCTYLAGNGPLTRYRENKYCALAGFYRYAISRGYARSSPLPDNEPKPPQSLPPYIYSRDELRRLFDCIETSRAHAVQLDAQTFICQPALGITGYDPAASRLSDARGAISASGALYINSSILSAMRCAGSRSCPIVQSAA